MQLKVFKVLEEKGIPTEHIEVIKELSTNTTTKIRTAERLIKEIKTNIGIRQEAVLSPLLFNVNIEKIIEAVKSTVNCLCYADDTVLMVESEDALQRLLHIFGITAMKYNMKIFAIETKSMVFSRETLSHKQC